jgi:hypothetical protein
MSDIQRLSGQVMNANRYIEREKPTLLEMLGHLQENMEYAILFLELTRFRKKKVSFGDTSVIEPNTDSGFKFDFSSSSTTSYNPGPYSFGSNQSETPYRPPRSFRNRINRNRLNNVLSNSDENVKEEKETEEKGDSEEEEKKDTEEEKKEPEIERIIPTPEDWEEYIFPGLQQFLTDDGMEGWIISEWMRRVRQEYSKVTDGNYLEVFHYILHHVTHSEQPSGIQKFFPDEQVQLPYSCKSHYLVH